MNQALDPQVVALTKAIRKVESGGNFGARGGSGEFGGYQYTPDTWAGVAPKYGINVSLEQATPQQQNEVTYKRIKEWKDKGHNVGQIASMWNAGEGRPNAYKENWRGVNSYGVVYDTPAYAKKVAQAYQSMKPQTVQAATTTPEPAQEKEPFSVGKLAKEIVSPVTTMIARPFQAAQLGAEMVRQSRQNPELEANAQKYNDEAYAILSQLKTMPEGPEKDKMRAEGERLNNLAQYYSGRLSKNASYQPFSTETLVKEAPQNFADVKKDVGRGVQTVAFGLGPVSGGAAFGAGMSLEEGNDLLSFDTLLYTAFGAGAGKAADIIGKPLLNASGKVIGKITPQTLKNVAAGGAKAVQVFMERNKLLPEVVSKPLNVGAEALERGANAPFRATASVFRKSDDQVIKARERALLELEEKYVDLRKRISNIEDLPASRGRVARSNVLVGDDIVNEDGKIIGAQRAAQNYIDENVGQGESLVRQLIQKEGVSVDLDVLERELQKVMKESFNGRELVSAMNAARREMAGLRSANKGGRISLVDVHDAKVSRQPGSKAYENSESKAIDKQIARAHKQVVEKNSKEKVKQINAEIGKYLGDADYIRSLDGKIIGSGKLGKAVSQVGGAVAGAAAGGAIGGLPGVAVGSYVGSSISKKLASRGYRRALGRPTSYKPGENPVFASGRAKLNAEQLRLPAGPGLGTVGNPIKLGPPDRGIGPVSVKAPKGEPARDPKTGRFIKTYLSTSEKELPKPVRELTKSSTVVEKTKALEATELDPKDFKTLEAFTKEYAKLKQISDKVSEKELKSIWEKANKKEIKKPKAKSIPAKPVPLKSKRKSESSNNSNKLDLTKNRQAGFINFGAMFGGRQKTMKPSQLISHEGAPDKLRVKFWKRIIKEGRKVKPLLVIKEGNKYGIEDGKHRFQAFKELGIKDIPVQIVG